jgi:integrase
LLLCAQVVVTPHGFERRAGVESTTASGRGEALGCHQSPVEPPWGGRLALLARILAEGDRHHKQFKKKEDAETFHAETAIGIKRGIHVGASKSPTVLEAGRTWLVEAEAAGLERATLKGYKEHLDQHIAPLVGALKLADIGVPAVKAFEQRLRKAGRSPAMVRKAVVSLGAIFAHAVESGRSAKNPVRELRRHHKSKQEKIEARHKGKLKIGVDIPSSDELGQILEQAPSRWRAFLIVAAFTGLRASELRGLSWKQVKLERNGGKIHVIERADRFAEIGPPKSISGEREVPFGQFVANALSAWRGDLNGMKVKYHQSSKSNQHPWEGDLVFPVVGGGVGDHANIIKASLKPACIAAGVVDRDGGAKYTGLHCLRHFYASWLIDRGLPPKVVQERMGHSSITVTYDTYGHLFPRDDDTAETSAAELAIIAGGRSKM